MVNPVVRNIVICLPAFIASLVAMVFAYQVGLDGASCASLNSESLAVWRQAVDTVTNFSTMIPKLLEDPKDAVVAVLLRELSTHFGS